MPQTRAVSTAVTIFLALSVTLPLPAQQRSAPVLRTEALEISINGRVHTQLNTTTVEGEPATEWELRRVRLEATVKVNDVVTGKIQPDFAGNRVSLKDAYLRLTLDPALQILAGQAHRPFGVISPTTSNRILPVERGVRIRGVTEALDQYNLVSGLGYSERDVGLQVTGAPRGAPLGLSYAAGFFNGPARADAGGETTYQLVARLAAQPAPGVRVGAGWSRRHFASTAGQPDDAVAIEPGDAWEVDLEVRPRAPRHPEPADSAAPPPTPVREDELPGVRVVGELSYGDYDPFQGTRFLGAQAWLAWRSRPLSSRVAGVEPVFRASYGDPNANDRGFAPGAGLLLTPGVNVYLGGWNRVMFNYDVWNPEEGRTRPSFKTQFQLAF